MITIPSDHKFKRKVSRWSSFGKDGKGPMVCRPVQELSDSHLVAIIQHVNENNKLFAPSTIKLMKDELAYRVLHNIKVKDYDTPKRNRRKLSRKNTNS